jgi:hypothetical protein
MGFTDPLCLNQLETLSAVVLFYAWKSITETDWDGTLSQSCSLLILILMRPTQTIRARPLWSRPSAFPTLRAGREKRENGGDNDGRR